MIAISIVQQIARQAYIYELATQDLSFEIDCQLDEDVISVTLLVFLIRDAVTAYNRLVEMIENE